jgi:hypothetical protein
VEAAEVRAVLDASVLVPETSRRELQQLAALGLYRAYWSPWIIAELNRVLTVRWLNETDGDMSVGNLAAMSRASKTMMAFLLQTLEVVNPRVPYPPAWPGLEDIDDMPIWAAARAAEGRYVVSSNSHDFPPPDQVGRHRWEEVEYLSVEDFLKRVLGGDG